jgi:hypothetical protein
VSAGERPVAAVPAWILWLLAACAAAQVAWHARLGAPLQQSADLPPAPSVAALRVASLGEPGAASRLAAIWLQGFDARGGNLIPYQRFDYSRLIGWLGAILDLDPRGSYPLFSAARVYSENPDHTKVRLALEFVFQRFLERPNERWQALAHAALVAKHRLNDLPLARRYASALERHVTDDSVPLWAKQMEIFILEDMNELEAAKVMLGGLLATGRIRDPAERRFLEARLEELMRRTQEPSRPAFR